MNFRTRSKVARSLAFLFVSLPLVAHAAIHAVGQGDVSFAATGTLGMHIAGASHSIAVSQNGTQVIVRVPLAQLETGIGLRDRHMREFLDVQHFPNAELVLDRASLQLPASGASHGTGHGTLAMHGQTHPCTFSYTATHSGTDTRVEATLHVNFEQYGVRVPNYLGVTVHPDVDVTAHVTVRDE